MKNIYMILLLLITGSIYAQEKELDIKKLAELVNSNEDFRQYFEELGWEDESAYSLIKYKTMWRDSIEIEVVKSSGRKYVNLSTNEPKLARRWRRQVSGFADFMVAEDTVGKSSHTFRLPKSLIEYESYLYHYIYIDRNNKELLVKSFGLNITHTTDVLSRGKIMDIIADIPARPRRGEIDFKNRLHDAMDTKWFGKLNKVVLRFVVEKDGEITELKTHPEAPELIKGIKAFFDKEPNWYPAKNANGDAIRSSHSFPISIRN